MFQAKRQYCFRFNLCEKIDLPYFLLKKEKIEKFEQNQVKEEIKTFEIVLLFSWKVIKQKHQTSVEICTRVQKQKRWIPS